MGQSDAAAFLWLAAGVAMVVHLAGFVFGLWSETSVTYWIALVLLIFVSAAAALA